MERICQQHPGMPVVLLCLEKKCDKFRLCCPLCVDQKHKKHDLVSVVRFEELMDRIQVNRNNPHKLQILKELNKTRDGLMDRLQGFKNKMIGLVGQCENQLEEYFSLLIHSFATPDQDILLESLHKSFTSERITQLLEQITETAKLEMGTFNETQTLLFVYRDAIQKKLGEASNTLQITLTNLEKSIQSFSLSKPQEFRPEFSRQRKQACMVVSDAMNSVERISGTGGHPMCLMTSPLNPIKNSVQFKVEKVGGEGKSSVCVGVCLEEVVRKIGYSNCNGTAKGVYAIDQNYPFSNDGSILASWNHHDTNFNQTNVGNSDLVGWTFKTNDVIRLEVDYYNSVLVFIKNPDDLDESQDEENYEYQMPIKLDSGPLYAFVSMQHSKGIVSIVG